MSEKRFVLWRSEDRDGYTDEWAVDDKLTGNRIDEDEVVEFLNEQQATISQLQDLCGESDGENAKLRIENKQLRQQHQRLYNYFRNYLEDEMSAENFGEMWDNVKEDERWNE